VTIHDVTAPLREGMPVWPGDPPFTRRERSSIARGDEDTVSELALGAHTGTHVDAPSHFVAGGATVGGLDLAVLIGECIVLDMTSSEGTIGAGDLEGAGLPPGATRLLAKTRNSGWSRETAGFREGFVALDETAAAWCVERGVRLLGIDYLSIEPFGESRTGHPVHRTLLEAGVVILEGLELASVEPGEYRMIALPLSIPDAEGAPARVVLVE
jgi:arylformamidase